MIYDIASKFPKSIRGTHKDFLLIKKFYASKIKKEFNVLNETEIKKQGLTKGALFCYVAGQHLTYPLYKVKEFSYPENLELKSEINESGMIEVNGKVYLPAYID